MHGRTRTMEKINRDNMKLEYDPLTESVIESVTGETVYREHGIGEIDLRNVMRGEVTWENSTDPFQNVIYTLRIGL
jgi:hypothetical protein